MVSLKRNIGISFIGTFVFSLSQWGIISAIAKIGGAEQVGIYALAMAIVSPVFALANLNLRSVQSTDVHNQYTFKQYRNLRFLTSISALAIITLILWVAGYRSEVTYFISAFAGAKFFESISELAYGRQQKCERMSLIAASMIMRGSLALLSFSVFYWWVNELFFAGLGLLASWALVALLYDYRLARNISQNEKSNSIHYIKPLLITTAPLGFVIFCNTINLNIPRYIINDLYGEVQLGIYAGISFFIVAGATIINAIGQSATPRLAKLYANSKPKFFQLQYKLLVVAMFIGLSGIVCSYFLGELVLTIFYNEEYQGYGNLFVWVMTAAMIMYCSAIIGCGLTAMRSFKIQSYLSLAVIIVVTAVSFYSIPIIGLTGGAIAIFTAYSVKLILAYFYLLVSIKKVTSCR